MRTIITDERLTVDSLVTFLEEHARNGAPVATAKAVCVAFDRRGQEVDWNIRATHKAGRIAVRRVRENGRRRTYLALPNRGHHLPMAGGAR